MKNLILFFSIFYTFLSHSQDVWIDMSNDRRHFEESVIQADGQSMNQYQLNFYESKNVEQSYLLSKIEFWEKGNKKSKQIDQEIFDLQKSYIFSQNNRLILFEYLKSISDEKGPLPFRNLCQLYSNDIELKTMEPFFESSCSLIRVSLKELNPNLAKFDFMLIDGSKINIRQSPFFFTSGTAHQFVFISNRYTTYEVTSTTAALHKSPIPLQPWVDGTCEKLIKDNTPATLNVRGYFSKDCVAEVQPTYSSFWSRSKYYIIGGLVLAFAAASVSSNYELGVTLQSE